MLKTIVDVIDRIIKLSERRQVKEKALVIEHLYPIYKTPGIILSDYLKSIIELEVILNDRSDFSLIGPEIKNRASFELDKNW